MQTESLILTFFVNLVLGEQMQKKYNISPEDDQVMGEVIPLLQPFKAGKPWQFAGAFYHATSVLTTIGADAATPGIVPRASAERGCCLVSFRAPGGALRAIGTGF